MKVLMFSLAATVAVMPATAQTLFTDRASFDAAAGPTTTEDFEACGTDTVGIAGPLSAAMPGPCSSIAAGVTFAPEPGFNLYIAAPGQSANTTTALGVDFPENGRNNIIFEGGSTAFAADFNQNFAGGSQSGSPAIFTIDAVDLNGDILFSFDFDVASGMSTFLGLTSATAFGQLSVRQAGGYAVVDNVSFNNGAVVPEPATWALMIAGFGAVGAAARRRTRIAYA